MMNTSSNESQINFTQEKDVLGSPYEPPFVVENNYVIRRKFGTTTTTLKKTNIITHTCEKDKLLSSEFYNLLVKETESEESFMMKNYYCFDYSDLKSYGKYSDDIFSYLEITLKLNEIYYREHSEKVKTLMNFTRD